MIQLLAPLTLLASGLASGIMLSAAIGGSPLNMTMSYAQFVRTSQFLVGRYDPFMPIVMMSTIAGDVLLAIIVPGPATRFLYGAATVLLLLVMGITLARNVPLNKYVATLDPGSRPDDWAERDPRPSWRGWHLVRTVFIMLSLTANAAAAATLI